MSMKAQNFFNGSILPSPADNWMEITTWFASKICIDLVIIATLCDVKFKMALTDAIWPFTIS